jgi:hypothetical protein
MAALVMGAALAGLPPGPVRPAAGATTASAVNMTVVGYNDLGGAGLNGEVAVVGDTAVVAAGITQDTIPHQHFYGFTNAPYSCPAVAVKVVDLSDPTKPVVASSIGVPAGVAALDVDALRMSTPAFTGDLAAVALAQCNATGSGVDRGVAYYDITTPTQPRLLSRYLADFDLVPPAAPPCSPANTTRCASSQHNVDLVQRADGRVLSMSTAPFSSGSNFPSGDMRIVDVTNPATPVQVGTWPVGTQTPPGGSLADPNRKGFSRNGCRPIETGHAAEFTDDGLQALLAFQDQGMFALDVQDPSRPTQAGQAAIYDRTNRLVEGTAGFVSATEFGGRRFALLAEEDWTAPATTLRIDSPASIAGARFACEAMFTLFDPEDTAQIYRKPGSQIAGEIVYVGRGCPVGGNVTVTDPYLANPSGKIALIDHTRDVATQPGILPAAGTGCGYDIKVKRAQDAGAVAVVMRRQGAVPEALSESGNPRVGGGISIPMIQVDTPDGNALRTTLCPAVSSGACTGGTPVTGAMIDAKGEWGGLNVIDITNPAIPALRSTYRTPGAGVFPPPDLGVYSAHHALGSGNRVFLASHSDGLRVLDISNPAVPVEVASFVPPDRPDPRNEIPGKALVTGVALAGNHVVITDVHSGLFVLGLTGRGYWSAAADGGVFAFGSAPFYGSAGGQRLNAPVVGITPTPAGDGYWLASADGGVFAYGGASFRGSAGALRLSRPVVAMAATPTGRGYWLVASDGGVFAFGDAQFYGSTASLLLNRPIVGMAPTPSGRGYWLVGADGGLFAFGDARFLGSTGGSQLTLPIVGITPTPTGRGYRLVAADGGVFVFGDAHFFGSTGSLRLNRPVVGMSSTPSSAGYWLVGADGGIFAFGDASFVGSTGAIRLNSPVVGLAAVPR